MTGKRVFALLPVVAVPFVVFGALAYDSYRWHKRRIAEGWRWE